MSDNEESREQPPLSTLVQTAIKQAVAEAGGMPTGFVATVEFVDDEGEHSWCTVVLDEQSPVTTLGLLRFHQIDLERSTAEYLAGIEDA